MYKEITKVKGNNSGWLKCMAGNVIYSLHEGGITYINDKPFGRYLSLLNFSVYKGELYYFENSILYKLEGESLVQQFKMEDVDKLKIVTENVLFSAKRLSRREKEYNFYDFSYNLLWSYSGNDFIKPDYGIAFYSTRFDATKICTKEITTGDFLWNYKLPEGYTIFLVPQVVEDVLFFHAFEQGESNFHLVSGLDIRTGVVLWQKKIRISHSTKSILANIVNYKNNLCYGYGDDKYQIFNPVTGEVVLEKNMSEYYAKGISPNVHRNAIYNDKLWFVSGRGEKVKFGALDIASSEIDFVQDCPLEYDYQFGVPVYYKGKLYLLDTGGTLYVFEMGEELK